MTWGVVVAALLLSAVGMMTIHSASLEMGTDYLPRQATWVALGVLIMLIAFSIDYHLLMGLAFPLYLLGLLSLVLVLVVGHQAGGARSWLGIGVFRFQPAELCKITTALLLARYLGRIRAAELELVQILWAIAIVVPPIVLLALQPDLGSAAMLIPLLAACLLVAGLKWRILLPTALLGILLAGGLWQFALHDYQKERVLTFVSPERDPHGAGYQIRQSKIAVGSGQVTGRGYQQGTQSQLRFLPARHTDFVFAVLAEERGFLGVISVLGLYGLYVLSGARAAMRARDRDGILLISGLLGMFSFHVLYNTAMVIGFVPITGIPLPFLSYGGSFTLLSFVATGLILNVDFRRYVNR